MKSGNEIGMSSIHKLYVLGGIELRLVEAKDLRLGYKLAIKYGQELWGSDNKIIWKPTPYSLNKKWIKQFAPGEMTPDLLYLIGLILGDGYIDFKRGRVVVTTIDDDVSNFLNNNGLGLKFIQNHGGDYYHYICKNESFVEFLKDVIGFRAVKAREKSIPDFIFKLGRNNVVAFLQGLFDSDGCCRSDRHSVSLTSTSKDIVKTTQLLLLNFGILSRIYSYNTPPSKKVKVWSSGYTLEINRGQSKIFLEKIGFRIKRKQLNGIARVVSYDCLSEFVPGIGNWLKFNMSNLGLKYSDIKNGLNKSFFSKSGNVTYKTLGTILDKCRNKESSEYLKINELYQKHYAYDEIVEITTIEENVYDFTVDDGHTVVYNGAVGHQTPKGQGNLYHRIWMADDNGYAKKEYGWWWGYTKEEIELIRKRMNNPMKFAQEYGLEFLASGRSVFDQMIIKKQRKNILKVGDAVIDKETGETYFVTEENGFRMYRKPKTDGLYVCGVDVSEGVEGGDYSVAIIWDRKTGEEVAMYRGLLPPDILAKRLNEWGRLYNNALMVVEINNHGLTTVTVLRQLIYPTLYFRQAKFETIGQGSSDKIGWKTTKLTRPLLIDDFAQAVRDGLLTIHSKELLNEMTVFVYNDNGDMQPQEGFHDDMVFGGGIGFQGFKVTSPSVSTQLDYTAHLPINFSY
jgi:intein/homing endonuclease